MNGDIEKILSNFNKSESEIIPVLQAVQEEFGYISEEAMAEISKYLRVPDSRIYSVATFYSMFRFTPKGKYHIMVCRGTACHVRGAPKILEEIEKITGIKEGETSEDLEFSLETVACIGACGLAPNVVVNDKTHGRMTIKKVHELFGQNKQEK